MRVLRRSRRNLARRTGNLDYVALYDRDGNRLGLAPVLLSHPITMRVENVTPVVFHGVSEYPTFALLLTSDDRVFTISLGTQPSYRAGDPLKPGSTLRFGRGQLGK